ncbi:MAG TPA: STAS domain-containing protein [Solirubrobacteraceae bacterium]|jgi:anti-anti-sigma factor
MGTERLHIETQNRDAAGPLLRVAGELDLVTAPALREAIERHEPGVVLDLSAVEFVDSTGLVLLMESTRDRGVVLRREVSEPVARLLEVTKTEQLFSWEG